MFDSSRSRSGAERSRRHNGPHGSVLTSRSRSLFFITLFGIGVLFLSFRIVLQPSISSYYTNEQKESDPPISSSQHIPTEPKPLPSSPAERAERILERLPAPTPKPTDAEWPPMRIIEPLAINKRLVVAAVNCGYLDFADNWVESVKQAGVTNFVFIALDEASYAELQRVYPDHTIPPLPGTIPKHTKAAVRDDQAAQKYGSAAFGNVVRSRPRFLLPFLRAGFTIFYSDIDTVWRSNAFDEFQQGEYDMSAPTDSHSSRQVGSLADKDNLCTGMLYLEPTRPTIKLLETWSHILESTHSSVNQGPFNTARKQLGTELNWKMADIEAFPPGFLYFRDPTAEKWKNWKSSREPVIIHNNWIVGQKEKRDRFIANDLWHPSGQLHSCVVSSPK